ncbi:hypothetical protein VTJ49DRAFT_2386 [Mycothermus thermophilus]|uniref:RRM domain-containing protein n=1 Tax=Humicola insolens TaxID=85995 RepID=A0ABR3VND9_HUMIN
MTSTPDTSSSPSGAPASGAFSNLPTTRPSPFPATATTTTTQPTMTVRSYVSSGSGYRPVATSQPGFASPVPAVNASFDRDTKKPIGTPSSTTPPTLSSARIRNLPLNTSEESLRLMLVFSEDLVDVEVLPAEQSPDKGFRSAILKFKTPAGALEAKNILHGKSNISNDAELIVEILGNSSPTALSAFPGDSILPGGASSATVTAGPSTLSSRPTSRFNGTFQSLDKISPPLNGSTYGDRATQDASTSFQNLFGPQSPIGNRLANGATKVTSKTLIDAMEDDETKELLKDPVGFAENGLQRRQTAPQLPIARMASLSLNTSPSPAAAPAPMPYYAHTPTPSLSGLPNTMSPTAMSGPAAAYTSPMPRMHHYPPANPADQNPPCNTLYVGNLPIDTSEEELKAMFSKQRGYKRLCFRTKQNGPMCFVEFEDITAATRALKELYGQPLHNSTKGGIRLSFSKNPLGVRSNQNQQSGAMANGMHSNSGFTTASGPPPGLAPPGLGAGRGMFTAPPGPSSSVNGMSGLNGVNGMYASSAVSGPSMNPWGGMYNGAGYMAAGTASSYPAYMMGR